ncbi:segregation/condensation protein A [Candidatus Uhrbacteria bacterium]|nr:segregation/condensation protein A [Candidatus Uhrbacteria bacterium]
MELIESKELEITKVSLAKVADEFVLHIEEQEVPSEELADFLLVASRLIYLKSKELMPYLRLTDEDEAADALADQLRIYREFVAAAERLEERYGAHVLFARPYVKPKFMQEAAFVPPVGVTGDVLAQGYRAVITRLEPFFALQEVSMERVKSVEERMEELREAIALNARMSFTDVTKGAQKKIEVVMSFLALLELLRRNVIRVTQKGTWGDIMIHRVE